MPRSTRDAARDHEPAILAACEAAVAGARTDLDFIRVAEKVSGLQLMWYLNYWTQTTKLIDYGVSEISGTSISAVRPAAITCSMRRM